MTEADSKRGFKWWRVLITAAVVGPVPVLLGWLWCATTQRHEPVLAAAGTQEVWFTCQQCRVIDGDTLEAWPVDETAARRVRLAAVDAPERGQAYYSEAKETMKELTVGTLYVQIVSPDPRWGRDVGYVWAESHPEGCLNHELVRRGLAMVDPRYNRNPWLLAVEARARQEDVGQWQLQAPIPPWEWRKGRRK